MTSFGMMRTLWKAALSASLRRCSLRYPVTLATPSRPYMPGCQLLLGSALCSITRHVPDALDLQILKFTVVATVPGPQPVGPMDVPPHASAGRILSARHQDRPFNAWHSLGCEGTSSSPIHAF